MSEEDVSCLVQMHEGFVGIPDTLHAALCNKLVNGILDAGESLGINAEGNTCTLVPVAPAGDIWLCEHVFTFSTRDEVEANISELTDVCRIPEDCENVLQAVPAGAIGVRKSESGTCTDRERTVSAGAKIEGVTSLAEASIVSRLSIHCKSSRPLA